LILATRTIGGSPPLLFYMPMRTAFPPSSDSFNLTPSPWLSVGPECSPKADADLTHGDVEVDGFVEQLQHFFLFFFFFFVVVFWFFLCAEFSAPAFP